MTFENPLNLDSAHVIDRSDDSIVYLIDDRSLFPNSVHYSTHGKVVVQELSPMRKRFPLNEVKRAANWNSIINNDVSQLGVRTLRIKDSAEVFDYYVAPNSVSSSTTGEILIASPYIPGPQLHDIHIYLSPASLIGLSSYEAEGLLNFTNRSAIISQSRMKAALETLEYTLRERSEIIHLDPVNVKFRWNTERNIPVLVVTDIQSRIGEGVIF